MSVAEKLNMKVYVDKMRWNTMKCYNWPKDKFDRLTTNPNETSLWVAPLGQINLKNLSNMRSKGVGRFSRIIGFQPTGWTFGKDVNTNTNNIIQKDGNININSNTIFTSRTNGIDIVYSIPYSEHSSFSELIDFLNLFRYYWNKLMNIYICCFPTRFLNHVSTWIPAIIQSMIPIYIYISTWFL